MDLEIEHEAEEDTEARGGARLNTENGRFLFEESAEEEVEASYAKVAAKKVEDERRRVDRPGGRRRRGKAQENLGESGSPATSA